MKRLTSSMEHYLKAIYALGANGSGVRVSDIASHLGVTKASASIAMKALKESGHIERDHARLVYLTDQGKWQAVALLNKAAILKSLFADTLAVDPETADKDACAIEHIVSRELLCSICKFVHFRDGSRCGLPQTPITEEAKG